MNFSDSQVERYSRHLILDEVGLEGQQKLLNSSVLIIGAGGLGSPAALYLAAAGVGTIGIADADEVDLSNLQRQVIHTTADLGKSKVESAKETIEAINPDVEVVCYDEFIVAANIEEIIEDYDFIIDGVDNFPTKYLINDACVLNEKAFSHAGILRFEGQTFTYDPTNPESACYRDLYPEPPPADAVPSCSQAGVLGVLGGILGTIQATEAIKCILGTGDLLVNRLMHYDAKKMDFRTFKFKRNKHWLPGAPHPTITELLDHQIPTCDLKG